MSRISTDSSTAATLRALSLLLAGLLWFSVIVERPGETRLQVPVRIERLPAGLWLATPPPGKIEVTVAGPKALLWLLPLRDVSCRVDLSRATAGSASYAVDGDSIRLPDRDLKVVRVLPATVGLTLTTITRK